MHIYIYIYIHVVQLYRQTVCLNPRPHHANYVYFVNCYVAACTTRSGCEPVLVHEQAVEQEALAYQIRTACGKMFWSYAKHGLSVFCLREAGKGGAPLGNSAPQMFLRESLV